MSIETLTYAALADRLNISPAAARSLVKRRRLARCLSDNGEALVSVDLAEIRHTARPRGNRPTGDLAALADKIAALQAEIPRLEARAAGHRADFERERERADRLMAEMLQATAEAAAAREAAARLEGILQAGERAGGSNDNRGQAASRLGHLVAGLVQADRKASR
jgi:hypothetical protein